MDINKDLCSVILDKLFPGTKYDLIDWKREGFSELVGYHGDHNILKVSVEINGEEKCFSFFIKRATNNPIVFDQYLSKIRCFKKEYYMLDGILDELQSQIKEKLTAQCYLSEMNKMIILEDLSLLGYKSAGEKATRWDHVKMATKKLAKLHAASIILEEKSGSRLVEKFPQIGFETFFNDRNTDEGLAARGSFQVFTHLLYNRMDCIPKDMKTPFHSWVSGVLLADTKISSNYRNVLCHGDPWHMNFMYKYKKSGEVEDSLMVDFQVSRIAPPALEVQQFLGLTYFNDLREAYSPKVFNTYYKQLGETLNNAGINVSLILPRNIFEESLNFYLNFGLCGKVVYTVTVRLPQEFLKTLDTGEKFINFMCQGDTELCTSAFDNNQQYRHYCTDAFIGAYNHFLKNIVGKK